MRPRAVVTRAQHLYSEAFPRQCQLISPSFSQTNRCHRTFDSHSFYRFFFFFLLCPFLFFLACFSFHRCLKPIVLRLVRSLHRYRPSLFFYYIDYSFPPRHLLSFPVIFSFIPVRSPWWISDDRSTTTTPTPILHRPTLEDHRKIRPS